MEFVSDSWASCGYVDVEMMHFVTFLSFSIIKLK